MTIDSIYAAVDTLTRSGNSAALELQLVPQAGVGSPINPPTYANDRGKSPYLLFGPRPPEEQSADSERWDHVQLNAIPAESNLMEQALAEAWRSDPMSLFFPLIEADLSSYSPHLNFSVLEAPHGLGDARLRECVDENEVSFRDLPNVKAALDSHRSAMTGLFLLAPVSILTGTWDTHAPKAEDALRRKTGTQLRLRRTLTAEILGEDVCTRPRKFVLQDPLQIASTLSLTKVDPSYADVLKVEQGEGEKKKNEPAVAGLSAVPDNGSVKAGGVTVARIRYRVSLAMPILRQYHFPLNGKVTAEVDHAARRVLVALGLLGIALRLDRGFCLRSNCDLDIAPGSKTSWKFHGRTRDNADLIFEGEISTQDAYAVYERAYGEAKELGLKWEEGRRITLKPSERFRKVLEENLRAKDEAAVTDEDEDENNAESRPKPRTRRNGKNNGTSHAEE